MDVKELLKKTGCDCIEDLYGYICYLQDVKEDYEFLKGQIKSLANKAANELY